MTHIFLPLGKHMKILAEIEHLPKHIFMQSKQGVKQCAWYFPMCKIENMCVHVHTINMCADLCIIFYLT